MTRGWAQGGGGRAAGNGQGLLVLLGVALLVALSYIWQGGGAASAGGPPDVQMMRWVRAPP